MCGSSVVGAINSTGKSAVEKLFKVLGSSFSGRDLGVNMARGLLGMFFKYRLNIGPTKIIVGIATNKP